MSQIAYDFGSNPPASRRMNVTVTGATGFIGRHLVPILLQRGHKVTALCHNSTSAAWVLPAIVKIQPFDLHFTTTPSLADTDILVHLAWFGFPRYRDSIHLDEVLPASERFLTAVVQQGVKRVLVTGTCFEYGMQSGALRADLPTKPVTAYAIAKDRLRQALERLQETNGFALQWARLFYLHGPGQSPHALLAQLDAAIDRGDAEFPMSGGEQQRDYLPVQVVAGKLADLIETPSRAGRVNICSGVPISVRDLVERYIAARGSRIRPKFGVFPYAVDEPMSFWGVP